MILGMGVDLVSLERIDGVWKRHGERFLKYLLTPEERVQFCRQGAPERFLAKRFAAKEAFSKAVGTGMRAPVLWRSIGTTHNELGAPQLVFEEPLETWLQDRGITRTWLSITDEKSHAFACVVLEGT